MSFLTFDSIVSPPNLLHSLFALCLALIASIHVQMSRTSKKSCCFIENPLKKESVTAVPGIGPVMGEALNKNIIDYAYNIVGRLIQCAGQE